MEMHLDTLRRRLVVARFGRFSIRTEACFRTKVWNDAKGLFSGHAGGKCDHGRRLAILPTLIRPGITLMILIHPIYLRHSRQEQVISFDRERGYVEDRVFTIRAETRKMEVARKGLIRFVAADARALRGQSILPSSDYDRRIT